MAMDVVDFEIKGSEMQFVEVELDPGEAAIGEAGSMMYMDAGIGMDAVFGDGSANQGGFLGKLLGGGGGGASIGPSAGVNLFPGFAQGGDPPVGRPYWVGENGRELRIDKTPGTIIPMNAPGANPGGTSVVQQNHFHITGPMDRRTQDQIAASVLLAAQRALNRNG